jgi:hypothetical protein
MTFRLEIGNTRIPVFWLSVAAMGVGLLLWPSLLAWWRGW